MATVTRGPTDELVLMIKSALETYEQEYADAQAQLYRQNPGSIRVRIVDPRFKGMSKSQRDQEVAAFLASLAGDDAFAEVSVLLLLTPAELRASVMNQEFEHPMPSNY